MQKSSTAFVCQTNPTQVRKKPAQRLYGKLIRPKYTRKALQHSKNPHSICDVFIKGYCKQII